jgi:hypothetical protein
MERGLDPDECDKLGKLDEDGVPDCSERRFREPAHSCR